MSGFEYRVIVAPNIAKKVKGVKTLADRFAHGLVEVMNTEAREGWEYVSNERFQVEGKSGMLGKAKTSEETFLIFRRAKNDVASMPLERRLETMVELRARSKPAMTAKPVAAPVATIMPADPVTPVPPPLKTPEPKPNPVGDALAKFVDSHDDGPRIQSDDAAPAKSSGIFSPLSTRDPDADEKHAPSFGPVARD